MYLTSGLLFKIHTSALFLVLLSNYNHIIVLLPSSLIFYFAHFYLVYEIHIILPLVINITFNAKKVTLRFENMFLYINRLNIHYFSFNRKAMNKIVYKLLWNQKKPHKNGTILNENIWDSWNISQNIIIIRIGFFIRF